MSDHNPSRPNGQAEGGSAGDAPRSTSETSAAETRQPDASAEPKPAAAEAPEAQPEPEAPDEAMDFAPGADAAADIGAVLAAEVETLQAQIADLTNRLLRAHADLDNLRKRAEREKQETARYAISNFAKDTVGLVDNFERAMQAVDAKAIENDTHLKALLEGVAMTEREFLNVLERHGVRRVTPKGQPFDPRLHQAVMERQDPNVANGTVVEVFQSGYTIEERRLRPAMVVVARGGGKAQATPPKADAAAADTGTGAGTESSETKAKAAEAPNDADAAPSDANKTDGPT